ncbi:MAG TPA: hypothetical protein VFP84_36055 [Kofleriaceae bacterium]|nr:hypothetical protein [Kofleriaceae bacterium]
MMSGPDPIERIEAALAKLGDAYEPPTGWEDRVLAATRRPVVRPSYVRRVMLMVPVLVLAGALVWLFVLRPRPAPEAFAMTVSFDRVTLVRSADAGSARGDIAHARAAGRGHRVLRVYNRDTLVLACAATPDGTVIQEVPPPPAAGNAPCTGDRDALAVSWVLQGTGEYKVIGLASIDRPIPPTQHNFDRDQGALIDADLARSIAVKKFDVE